MGLGATFVMPATLSILNARVPAEGARSGHRRLVGRGRGRDRDRPDPRGLLLSHFWWGSVFLINLPLAAVALAG